MITQSETLSVIFMGTSLVSVPCLEAVAARERVRMVVTQPDRPGGRGRQLMPSPVKKLAERLSLPVMQPVRIQETPVVRALQALEPDVILVAAFGQILPGSILRIPRLGCLNVHPSLLPRYRGAAPINWSILSGDKVTGVTIMAMDEGMDTGDILLQEEVAIGEDETAEELAGRLAEKGADLLVEALRRLKAGTPQRVAQDHARATMAPMLKKEDGRIDWGKDADTLRNQVRGLQPWPLAFTTWKNKRITVYRATKGTGSGVPGRILSLDNGIEVACGTDSVIIKDLQLEGSRRMGWKDFVRGRTLTAGDGFN